MVVIAAVDDETDERVVKEGKALADAFDDELHVVHAMNREGVEQELREGGTETALERATDRAADVARKVTAEFQPIGRIGGPAQELDDYTDSVDARYLVVGGRKRTPIGKALFGSVTQSVLLSVDVPVVAVRQPDE